MRTLPARLLMPLAALALLGLGCSGDNTTAQDEGTPTPELTSEETARVMLDALRAGDVETFLAHTDVRGIYMEFPPAMRRVFTYEQFLAALENAKAKVGDADLNSFKDLTYEILGVEERDGFDVVTFRTQKRPGSKWKTFEAAFAQVSGAWKLSGRGLRQIKPDAAPN